MHIFVSARGSLCRIYDGTRLCTNCARIQRFHPLGYSFQRKADSPICWKRCWLKVEEGAVGVGFGAPKAGALAYAKRSFCAGMLFPKCTGFTVYVFSLRPLRARIVKKCIVFKPFGLFLSEDHIPRVLVNVSNQRNWIEPLELIIRLCKQGSHVRTLSRPQISRQVSFCTRECRK